MVERQRWKLDSRAAALFAGAGSRSGDCCMCGDEKPFMSTSCRRTSCGACACACAANASASGSVVGSPSKNLEIAI